MTKPDDIVGHATFTDGKGGRWHEPMTRAVADELWARAEAAQAKRAADMPDVPAAIRALTDAYRRLEELGWGDVTHCPKDGSEFEVIEPGSSGIHRCIYRGQWPDGTWWILHDGDMSPSRPVLWRRIGSCAQASWLRELRRSRRAEARSQAARAMTPMRNVSRGEQR